jgi:protein-S-isoprenylcysteine O-methyltransferase Ste14
MRRYRFPQRYRDIAARCRVPGGFLLATAFAYFSRPSVVSLAAGLPVSVLGLLLRGWAAGHLAKDRQLATSGPYAYLRNPLYLGSLLVAAGLGIASRSIPLGVLFAVVFLFVYLPVIESEEEHLARLFPDFAGYAARVPMLWPRFPNASGPAAFGWKLYFKNEEYQALLGFLAGVALLVWKVW